MDLQTAIIVLVLVVLSVAFTVFVITLSRSLTTPDPRKDPNILSYLTARGYAATPLVDARPASIASLYPQTVFGVFSGLSFALSVMTYRSKSSTTLYVVGQRLRIGSWFSRPLGQVDAYTRMFVSAGQVKTHDERYDAQYDTFRTGPDGPNPEVRARLLAFPGGLESAGWVEGSVAIAFLTNREFDASRLDAAFALAYAIATSV